MSSSSRNRVRSGESASLELYSLRCYAARPANQQVVEGGGPSERAAMNELWQDGQRVARAEDTEEPRETRETNANYAKEWNTMEWIEVYDDSSRASLINSYIYNILPPPFLPPVLSSLKPLKPWEQVELDKQWEPLASESIPAMSQTAYPPHSSQLPSLVPTPDSYVRPQERAPEPPPSSSVVRFQASQIRERDHQHEQESIELVASGFYLDLDSEELRAERDFLELDDFGHWDLSQGESEQDLSLPRQSSPLLPGTSEDLTSVMENGATHGLNDAQSNAAQSAARLSGGVVTDRPMRPMKPMLSTFVLPPGSAPSQVATTSPKRVAGRKRKSPNVSPSTRSKSARTSSEIDNGKEKRKKGRLCTVREEQEMEDEARVGLRRMRGVLSPFRLELGTAGLADLRQPEEDMSGYEVERERSLRGDGEDVQELKGGDAMDLDLLPNAVPKRLVDESGISLAPSGLPSIETTDIAAVAPVGPRVIADAALPTRLLHKLSHQGVNDPDPSIRQEARLMRMEQDVMFQGVWQVFGPDIIAPLLKPSKRSQLAQNDEVCNPTPRARLRPHTTPYHPSFQELEEAFPHLRVYWIIPIHGDVFIPSLSGPQPSSAALSKASWDLTSAGSGEDYIERIRSTWPDDIIWCREDLFSFWSILKEVRSNARFGAIALHVQSPSPNPFSTSWSSFPALTHQHTGRLKGVPAVRAEVGVHLRVYCDLQYARRLRWVMWDVARLVKGKAVRETYVRSILEDKSFTLVGGHGEVLAVI